MHGFEVDPADGVVDLAHGLGEGLLRGADAEDAAAGRQYSRPFSNAVPAWKTVTPGTSSASVRPEMILPFS